MEFAWAQRSHVAGILTTLTLPTFSYVYMIERERWGEHFYIIEMDGYWMLKPENHIVDGREIQAVHCNFM